MTVRAAVVVAALAVLFAACGSRTPSRAAVPGLDQDGCGQSGLSVPLREVVLDSAALGARMVGLLQGVAAPDTVSLLVRQTRTSTTVSVHRRHGLQAEVAGALADAVRNDLLPPGNEHGNPPYRIALATADRSLHLGRVRMCPPVLLNGDEVSQIFRRGARGIRDDGTVHIGILVDTAGMPNDVAIFRSSGDADLDAVGLTVASLMRFRPAMWDDEPVETRFATPLEVRVR